MAKNTGTLLLIPLIIVSMLFSVLLTPANADDWGPWETTGRAQKQTSRQEFNLLDQAVRNFQRYISPVDGARCPMYPTCSSYARQALHKHGPLLGIFMTADRLIHEGDPLEQRQPILKWGYRRYFDPLGDNDYWLQR